jgi:predicted permease
MLTHSSVITGVLPIFIYLFLGFFLQKVRFLKRGSVSDIRKIIVFITLPCLLFVVFSKIELRTNLIAIFIIIYSICSIMVLLGKASARVLRTDNPFFPLMMGGYETGMVGYAIFISIYGIENADTLASLDLGQLFFVWTALIAPLMKLKEGKRDSRKMLKMFFTSPVILSIVVGVIFSLLRKLSVLSENSVYVFIRNFCTTLGGITVPLICIVIGYDFRMRKDNMLLTGKTIVFRYCVHFILALLVNNLLFIRILNLGPLYGRALLVMFLLPPPFVYTLFTKEDDLNNTQYVAQMLSMSTVVSIVLISIVAAVFRAWK